MSWIYDFYKIEGSSRTDRKFEGIDTYLCRSQCTIGNISIPVMFDQVRQSVLIVRYLSPVMNNAGLLLSFPPKRIAKGKGYVKKKKIAVSLVEVGRYMAMRGRHPFSPLFFLFWKTIWIPKHVLKVKILLTTIEYLALFKNLELDRENYSLCFIVILVLTNELVPRCFNFVYLI